MESYLPIIFYQIPESFLLILCALGLLGLRIRLGRLLIAGLGLSAVIIVSRHFLFKYNFLHTPVILAALILVLSFGFKLSLKTSITGCFLSFFLLRMGESQLAAPVLNITKTSFEATLLNPWLHIGFGWLSEGFIILAVLICHLGGVALIKAPEAKVNTQ